LFCAVVLLQNVKDWRKYRKSRKRPDDIPYEPAESYKNKGWEGYGDWLGTGTIATHLRTFRKFENARAFVHKLKLRSREKCNDYCKSGQKPVDIPTNPHRTYKNRGWKGMADWLGKKE